MPRTQRRVLLPCLLAFGPLAAAAEPATTRPEPLVVTANLTLEPGAVLVKRGGVGHGPSDRQLWIVTGLSRAEAAAAGAAAEGQRMRLDRVDRMSFRFESAGELPWTVWLDGFAFE